ncbi:MAG TPA: formate dehydrogenase accessory sulfurtransferase FdhD [Mucilaginibacter sp.]|nr:formate dehydrogenase accessory sulfurtransferase FdhD [Mucilaginibacter sp.]
MPSQPIIQVQVTRITCNESNQSPDILAVEEPLEIQLEYGPENNRIVKKVSVTMRTPGSDEELAKGFLFTEGIINNGKDVLSVGHVSNGGQTGSVVRVCLAYGVTPALKNTERNFYTTSSCGVCGKASIDAVRVVNTVKKEVKNDTVNAEVIYRLPAILARHQQVFADTGGLHASALFGLKGNLLLTREDVGRHNALDKLIGAALDKGMLPLNQHVLLLSGRASFELVQKAVMAGITIIVAIGAPSSLAVQLAEEFNITLIGFLRQQRFNIYTAPQRILTDQYENTY